MSQGDADQSFIAQALPAFIAEAREQVAGMEQLLLQLEDRPDDRELLDALFRCAHTVKGSAGIFGLDEIVAFTHHVETLLDRLRDGAIQLSPDLGTLLLKCNDEILRLVDVASGAAAVLDLAVREALVEALGAASGAARALDAGSARGHARTEPATTAPAPPPRRWRIGVQFGPDTFRNGTDPAAVIGYLASMGTLSAIQCLEAALPALDALDPESCHLGFDMTLDTAASRAEIESAFSFVQEDSEITIAEPAPAESAPVSTGRPQAAVAEAVPVVAGGTADKRAASPSTPAAPAAAVADDQRLIRVAADRLDAVINLVGELVIASAGASLLAAQSTQATLIEANAQIARLVEEIRNSALQLRMVPIGETFARYRRVVRDTASQLGKDVVLEISGGDTELDKSMVERIADPLMHLVRNALDHGLETREERVAAGKAPQGRLALAACHDSGAILIRISDDGRGIRRQRVLERAWERGLVERGVTPGDDAIVNLIFAPGFSTAEQVTNLSGRGVGMDVVRRNIETLRGTVSVSSLEGSGSTIEIRLPLTLAIIDGFLLAVGESKFILPLEAVVEVIDGGIAEGLEARGGRGCIELRGKVLPVVCLRALYDLGPRRAERSSIVVVRAGAQRFGVRVDQLHGQHQTVIKPLGRMFRELRGISGSSILGNGEIALILDVSSFHQMAGADPVSKTVGAARRAAERPQPIPNA